MIVKPANSFRRPLPSGFGKLFRLTGLPVPAGPALITTWSLATGPTDGTVNIVITTLGAAGDGAVLGDGLGTITDLEFRYEGEFVWYPFAGTASTATGTYTISRRLIPGETVNLQVRARGFDGRVGRASTFQSAVVAGSPMLMKGILLPDGSLLLQGSQPIVQLVPA